MAALSITTTTSSFDFISGRVRTTSSSFGPHLIPFHDQTSVLCDLVPDASSSSLAPKSISIPTRNGRPRVVIKSSSHTITSIDTVHATSVTLSCESSPSSSSLRRISSSLFNLIVAKGCEISHDDYILKVESCLPSSSTYLRITPSTLVTFTSTSPIPPTLLRPKVSTSYLHPHANVLLSYLNIGKNHVHLRPRGLLLSGPSGSGKTYSVLQALRLSSISYRLIRVNTYASLLSSLSARVKHPTLILCSRIDAICPSRKSSTFNSNRRVARVLTLLDGFCVSESTVFVATTSNPNGIDEALRRPGRLDVELSYRLPLPDDRVVILESLLGFKSDELTSYARTRCSGFTLSKLSSLADTYALTSAFPEDASFTSSENKNEDVAGLSNIKLRLSQTIEWPLKYPKRFQHFGLSASRGLLLYGPPGTGKTSLVRGVWEEYHFHH